MPSLPLSDDDISFMRHLLSHRAEYPNELGDAQNVHQTAETLASLAPLFIQGLIEIRVGPCPDCGAPMECVIVRVTDLGLNATRAKTDA